MDVFHGGGTLGRQTGDDQRRTGTEVGGADGGTVELGLAGDDGGLAADDDIGAHLLQLGAVAEEAGLIHAFGETADTVGQRHAHAQLRLHIGGEAGVGTGLDGGVAQLAVGLDADGIVVLGDLHRHFTQLGGDALHVLGDNIAHKHIAACGCHSCHVGAGLDLVGDDGIAAALQLLYATDLHRVGTGAGDVGAHGVEEVGKVDDVGLLCRVFNVGSALNEDGCHHDVGGGAHGGHIQADAGAVEAVHVRLQLHILLGLRDLSAQGTEALDVLVDGTGCKVAAAGQSHMGMTEATQQHTHEVVAGTELAHQSGVGLGAFHIGAVDDQHTGLFEMGLCAHVFQNFNENAHIGDVGNILDPAFTCHQKGSGQNGNGGIFGAADDDIAPQRGAAFDFISGQGIHSLRIFFVPCLGIIP